MNIRNAFSPAEILGPVLASRDFDSLRVITDDNVLRYVWPLIENLPELAAARVISIPPGEENKNIGTLCNVWRHLSDDGSSRDTLLLALGGGVVTDLAAFAAATFKRGIPFINIPTTLLGAVDAAIGGKNGIDFNGIKNEIGTFRMPEEVIITTDPFRTLPDREWRSGLAEMVKTAMIADMELYRRMLADDLDSRRLSPEEVADMARRKLSFVEKDLHDTGVRRFLNFGHTAGHAFEALLLNRNHPISHGEAVANGIAVALIISRMTAGLPMAEYELYLSGFLRRYFPRIPLSCRDIDPLLKLISHDKKNGFIILREIGAPEFRRINTETIAEALEIFL